MLQHLQKRVHELRQAPPGERFQQYFRKRQGNRPRRVVRILVAAAGLLSAVVGLVMLFTPGPGIVLLVAGGAILAEESLCVARVLDGTELRLRALIQRVRGAIKKVRAGN